jgi:hypothetical protein
VHTERRDFTGQGAVKRYLTDLLTRGRVTKISVGSWSIDVAGSMSQVFFRWKSVEAKVLVLSLPTSHRQLYCRCLFKP